MDSNDLDSGSWTLGDVLLLPLKVLFTIALWIVGVWLYLLMLAVFIGVPVAIGIALFSTIFGGGGDDGPSGRSETVDDYLKAVAPSLDSVSGATENWSQLVDMHALLDFSDITQNEARQLAEDELGAARSAKEASTSALKDIRGIIPPDACKDEHLAVIEALQLSERGFLEIISYMSSALRGGQADNGALREGNRLLNEADRVKSRALVESSGCWSE